MEFILTFREESFLTVRPTAIGVWIVPANFDDSTFCSRPTLSTNATIATSASKTRMGKRTWWKIRTAVMTIRKSTMTNVEEKSKTTNLQNELNL